MGSCASNANRLGWKYRATAATRFYSSRANRLGWGYHATAATRSYSSIINRLEWGGRYRATATMGLCSSSANRLAPYGHNGDLCIARQPVRVGVQCTATTGTIHRETTGWGGGTYCPTTMQRGLCTQREVAGWVSTLVISRAKGASMRGGSSQCNHNTYERGPPTIAHNVILALLRAPHHQVYQHRERESSSYQSIVASYTITHDCNDSRIRLLQLRAPHAADCS